MVSPAAATPPALCVLLSERRRFAGQPVGAETGRFLARADRPADAEPGEKAQLLRHFDLLPRGWPMAAITRQRDAGDAVLHRWLRADPAHVRPDMNGARVLAIGELGLSAEEAQALLAPLRPLFGDLGFQLSAPVPSRWYVALPVESRLPPFSAPDAVLGDDLFAHLPDGPEGRRWRALLNEAQVILHNHPVNELRTKAGKPAVNSLCFWGAGRLPDHVRSVFTAVASQEPELLSLAQLAGIRGTDDGPQLLDLRQVRDWSAVEQRLLPGLRELGRDEMVLDFADGARFSLRAAQRWRWWRRPLARLA
ncbi:MAG: phosphoglycerate mutase [Arenimonas sp.]|uniref:phosphoglycerate mutase n=1 Tax=Arenimonas sp. TaxID=1872635 RepID=UPI0025C2EA59|nr:phosphoglycerate mutase [Arenimonas sp.]MBW8366330.1 phosphoglycerate mutase [Arenimonas sp.]